MKTQSKCVQYLESLEVEFKYIPLLEEVHSVQDVQRACNCEAQEVLKTLLFVGSTPVVVVVPGDKKVDIQKVQELAQVKNLKFATPKEVQEITGYEVGCVTPFGINPAILQVADSSLKELENLYVGSGEKNALIRISQSSFVRAFTGTFSSISV